MSEKKRGEIVLEGGESMPQGSYTTRTFPRKTAADAEAARNSILNSVSREDIDDN